MSKEKIRIVTLLGTSRPSNYTGKALALVQDELASMEHVEVVSFDPAGKKLAFPGEEGDFPGAIELQEMVESATGIIFATPEYHGSPAAMAKLIVENLGFPSTFAGKPVALLGVAAGRIGAIKSLEILRSICSHVGALVLPSPVSVAGVQQVFDEEGNCSDAGTEKQLRGLARKLTQYIDDHVCPKRALEQMVRD